jgi:hypothetical protein
MNEYRGYFPRRTDASKIGKTGVDIVASIVNEQLGWLFRQNHQEDDFGIDGYVDVVLDDGSVTGQSIAVQIKTGPSFFETKTLAGYVYRGDPKHLNYYLNHQAPIIIILCNSESKTCYWEVFEAEKTEGTTTSWKMVIPFANVLSNQSKEALSSLVGPPTDHSDALQSHWAFTKALQTYDRVMMIVTRSQIENLNAKPLLNYFDRFLVNPTTCTKLQGRVVLTISGYDQDKRELWEIPEVRKWISCAEPQVKYWFFFLATTDGVLNSLKLLLSCICDAKRIAVIGGMQKIEITWDPEVLESFMERNFAGLNELTEKLGLDDQNKRISFDAMRALGTC